MSITGIISEYNPFHNGHKYLIEQRKLHDPTASFIAVMSGNFTQRGEIALLDKWQRAQLAVNNGIDLVLELPFCFAVRSAEFFAKGGINLLKNLNIVDTLCFGSEYTDANLLENIAQISCSDSFQNKLKESINKGKSYAAATSEILSTLSNVPEAILKAPNTILGIEYLKANIQTNANLNIDIIQRKQAEHNDLNYQENFASGTAIRHSLYTNNSNFSKLKQVVPKETYDALQTLYFTKDYPNLNHLFKLLLAKIQLSHITELENIYNMREGLEHKFLSAALNSSNIEDFSQQIKSKRYPLTNIQRLILYLLLNITKEDMAQFDKSTPLYARVLAFNPRGAKILKQLKTTSNIPIINKTTMFLDSKKRFTKDYTPLEKMLSLDTYATELYGLCFNQNKPYGKDFTTSPYFCQK